MSYEKFKRFSQRNLLYTYSAGGPLLILIEAKFYWGHFSHYLFCGERQEEGLWIPAFKVFFNDSTRKINIPR